MFGDNFEKGEVSDSGSCAVILKAGDEGDNIFCLESICSCSDYGPKSTRREEGNIAIFEYAANRHRAWTDVSIAKTIPERSRGSRP
jgi:hypothetical protein